MDGYRVMWRSAGNGRVLWRYASGVLPTASGNVVYLGGSITQGAGSSGGEKWQAIVARMLDAAYPAASLTHRNKGVGGTPSWYGCIRLQADVIDYAPVLVFVDFAVNDIDGAFLPAAEALIRRLRTSLPDAPIVFLDFVRPGDSVRYSVRGTWAALCARYTIPRLEFAQMLNTDAGTLLDYSAAGTYFADSVHPNITGHAVAGNAIGRWIHPTAVTSTSKPWGASLPARLLNCADFERTPTQTDGALVPSDTNWTISGAQKYTTTAGAVMTYVGTFSSVGIDTDYGSGQGAMSWRIDGGAWTAINLGTRNHWLQLLTLVTYGAHTLEIRCDSGRVGVNRVMTI